MANQSSRFNLIFLLFLLLSTEIAVSQGNQAGRKEYLDQLKKVLPNDIQVPASDQLPGTPPARVSPEDFTWNDWLSRTGELPPSFKELPSLPFLPDPMVLDEDGEKTQIKTIDQWNKKREHIKSEAQYWITGTVPPAPGNLSVEILREESVGDLIERDVILRFGPNHEAQLHVTLLIPPGEGPHPVFICPWKKDQYNWVQAAVRRGYIGCRFTATDPKYGYPDDSETYQDIWWPDYDFSTITRWGWAASRAIDYLYTLPVVNREQIALAGLSRNGKMALWAAAYDERIKAVIPISGGTGGEVPYRYTSNKYGSETIEVLTRIRPHWLHPRSRFFVGNESKFPVDANSLMALVAPRGLMITCSIHESAGNPWGIEQAYLSAKQVYSFLGAEENIAIDQRHGLHSPSGTDIERYIDFCDFVFSRGNIKPENKLYHDYSFSKWLGLSGENINPLGFPRKEQNELLIDDHDAPIRSISDWDKKLSNIRERINWGLGNEPASVGPGKQEDYMRDVVGYPRVHPNIQSTPLLFGQLFTPDSLGGQAKLPVVIYLHEYSYSTGYIKAGRYINRLVDAGFAVFAFDQIGFGSRIEEGRLFYERFPNWSKMGRMVADVRWAIDELSRNKNIDSDKIFIMGYSLGATVGLYSTALDERIAGLVSVCGFTPMRYKSQPGEGEGLLEFSHLHGLLPRLGFFIGNENRLPYDYDEMLAAIAPRQLLVISPTWDQYASNTKIKECINKVEKVFNLYDRKENLTFHTPEDYNRFSGEMQTTTINWLKNHD